MREKLEVFRDVAPFDHLSTHIVDSWGAGQWLRDYLYCAAPFPVVISWFHAPEAI